MRADARAKRAAVLTAAVDVFTERGVDIPLDEVARRAGVGIATLYRHFPTREALITGAYVQQIGVLCDGVVPMCEMNLGRRDRPPCDVCEAWLAHYEQAFGFEFQI